MTIRFTAEERETLKAANALKRRQVVAEKTKIVLPPRPSISPARKARIHAAHEGQCHVCGTVLPVLGPTVQYDHVKERAFEGPDEDANLAPICTTPCHAQKTAEFLGCLAKANRVRSKHLGEKKSKQSFPSRPFNQWGG